jgi:hypothetical protein
MVTGAPVGTLAHVIAAGHERPDFHVIESVQGERELNIDGNCGVGIGHTSPV